MLHNAVWQSRALYCVKLEMLTKLTSTGN